MSTREVYSFCRICSGSCGLRLQVEGDRIVSAAGDRANPLTRGYACFKGLQSVSLHNSPDRLLHPLKRQEDGSFVRIGVEQALDEIAERIGAVRDRHGPDAVGLYVGNGAFPNATVVPIHYDFMGALGSSSRFTSATIDQSAKMVSAERLGGWGAPKPHLDQSDVALVLGGNPLVSHQTSGIVDIDPLRTLKAAKARGLKLIVIDPRRHETARHADLFLQCLPGQDAAIVAALLKIILDEGWEDRDFCAENVDPSGLADLRTAIAPFDEERVTARAGLEPGQLRAAARMFSAGRQGVVYAFTGTTMGPHSNVAQHLADCLNIICGRFLRAGDTVLMADMIGPPAQWHAEVVPPSRSWEAGGAMSRIRGVRTMFGEKMTGNLADEILTPGDEQVRALIVHSGNPASSVPDQRKMVRALGALDLCVTIDPFMTNTARLSDYVIPPRMMFERADLPLALYGTLFYPRRWVQYTPAIVPPPEGSELVEDWYVFWSIAKRLGLPLNYAGKTPMDMVDPPTTDELLALRTENPAAPFEEILRHPHGMSFDDLPFATVQPRRAGHDARFHLMPADVAAEVAVVEREQDRAVGSGRDFPFLLAVRRMPFVYNSVSRSSPEIHHRTPYNPAFMNPLDMAEMGLGEGDRITLTSDNGSVVASAAGDEGLRRGVVSLSHSWGLLPGEEMPGDLSASVNMLISTDRDMEAVNAMPRMSAIPVNIAAFAAA